MYSMYVYLDILCDVCPPYCLICRCRNSLSLSSCLRRKAVSLAWPRPPPTEKDHRASLYTGLLLEIIYFHRGAIWSLVKPTNNTPVLDALRPEPVVLTSCSGGQEKKTNLFLGFWLYWLFLDLLQVYINNTLKKNGKSTSRYVNSNPSWSKSGVRMGATHRSTSKWIVIDPTRTRIPQWIPRQ